MKRATNFSGYGKDAMRFWPELAAEMNREWFQANKPRYEREWVAPTTALLAAVGERLAPAYRPLALGAPKLMRIHRDVRFSRDKSPYKTHLGAVITVAGAKMTEGADAALYLHVGLGESFVGVGAYVFDRERLERYRKAAAGPPGAVLAKLVAKLRKAGYDVGGHDDYKQVPRGFDPDHPRADLLRMKGLTGGLSIPPGRLSRPDLADWLVEHGKALAPLVKWLHANV